MAKGEISLLGNALGAFYTLGASSQAALAARTATQSPQAVDPSQATQKPAAASQTSAPEVSTEKSVESSRATAESRFRSFLDGLIEADASRVVSGSLPADAQATGSRDESAASGRNSSSGAEESGRGPLAAYADVAEDRSPVRSDSSNASESREHAEAATQEQTQKQAQARTAYAQAMSPTRLFG